MSDQMIDVPGGQVWAEVVGAGSGLPLLCLHGGPGFPHDYLRPLASLGDSRPVVFYDQLGCGRSDHPGDSSLWTLERALAEVDAVRRALDLAEFHLFGSSWGGLLAVEYALSQPPGLRSLVLSSPLVSVPRWAVDAEMLKSELPEGVRQVIDEHERMESYDCPEYVAAVLEFWRRHVCRATPWPADLERAFSGFGVDVYREMWGPSEFTQTGNLRGVDPTERLPQMSVPSLWTCGRHDEATPDSTASFQARTPNSELAVFEDSSHMAHFEEPESYLKTVADFLLRADER